MRSLNWRQVNACRLSQHSLSQKSNPAEMLAVASRVVGIQAQVMSAAEQALAARVDGLARSDVQAALWQERTLLKTWAMRGTLHLIPARDLPLHAAARGQRDSRNWVSFFEYYGVSQPLLQEFLDLAPQILSDQPMTRAEIAQALEEQTGSRELREVVASGNWGSPLKPLAWRGDLCFGPNQGQNVTFVNPRKWAGDWQPLEPWNALRELLRRYLSAYGPSTPEQFAHWWDGGSGLTQARKLFKSLEDETETVDVEGWRAVALRESLSAMQDMQSSGVVNLLPLFDAYVIGLGRHRELLPHLPAEYHSQVFRPQGWISAVVLVDGEIVGVWEIKTGRSENQLRLRLFTGVTAPVKAGIVAEVERLAWLTGLPLRLVESA